MPSVNLLSQLPGAVDRGEIHPFYQPQVDVTSGWVVGAEALCRWQHPVLGMISPLDFIPLAEESGDIHDIGAFMIESACALAADLAEAQTELAVNVSAVQLSDPSFSARFTERFQRHGLGPGRVTIELTESRPVLDLPDAIAQLDTLRALGIGLSIDDFGSGHSSLKQLEALPFSELKIDQSLIREDTDETWSQVSTQVAIARHRGLRIVAEGIETAEQYARVRLAGCDRAQGYFLGRPMPRDEFVSLVSSGG